MERLTALSPWIALGLGIFSVICVLALALIVAAFHSELRDSGEPDEPGEPNKPEREAEQYACTRTGSAGWSVDDIIADPHGYQRSVDPRTEQDAEDWIARELARQPQVYERGQWLPKPLENDDQT